MQFDIQAFMEDQKVDTYTFPLHRSSYGMKEPRRVTCKVIDIFEKASLGHLPERLQNEFFKNVETVQDEINHGKMWLTASCGWDVSKNRTASPT